MRVGQPVSDRLYKSIHNLAVGHCPALGLIGLDFGSSTTARRGSSMTSDRAALIQQAP